MQAAKEPSCVEPYTQRQFAKRTCNKDVPSNEGGEVVYLIDHEADSRKHLVELAQSLGIEAVGFESACRYFSYPGRDCAACLIVDYHLPDTDSLTLLRQVKEQAGPPLVFVSRFPDVSGTVRAMRAGALDFFEMPLEPETLRTVIRAAFAQHRKIRQREEELAELRRRLSLLTARERQVLPYVIGGLLNKQAAALLGISEVTFQIHRSQVVRKMAAESVADLVRMAVKLGIPHRREGSSDRADPEDAIARRPRRSDARAVAS